ncbi:MAG: hypothetical protein JNK48_34700 [Bryobacterales bacterium]|nr:hypothetical protein [Bryobacterales bacterium]
MNISLKTIAAGLMLGNLLCAQIATTIVSATTAATPLVFPNCTTPNFAVPSKPKDTKRFVHGDQVKDSGGRKEFAVKETVSAVYDGATGWMLTAGQEILRFDLATGKLMESHSIPGAAAFLIDGDTIWVGTGAAQLFKYSRSLKKLTLIASQGNGSMLRIATDGTNVVALSNGTAQANGAYHSGILTVVRADGSALTSLLNASPAPHTALAVSLVLESGYAWVTYNDGKIVQLPVTPNGEPQQKHTGDTDAGKVVDAVSDGASLWMVNEGSGNVTRFDFLSKMPVSKVYGAPGAKKLLFDGTSLWVAAGDRVVQFHGTDSRKLAELAPGTKPTAMMFDGMKVWLADRYSGTLKPLP